MDPGPAPTGWSTVCVGTSARRTGTKTRPGPLGTLERMSGDSRSERPAGRFRRLLGKLAATEPTAGGPPRPGASAPSGCTPIRDCGDRELVRVTGTLRTVTVRPRAGAPALEAELHDGSAALDVVWLGRRTIAGVEPGRALTASGRISMNRGRPVLFNPKYELRPLGTE